jgi:GT2 family glycosyltransferase
LETDLSLSVCIVNVNNLNLTLQCLQSVFDYSAPFHIEVIVVNNSDPLEGKKIKETFPDVTVVQISGRQGFADNYNLAITMSTGKYILVMNNDTVIYQETLPELVQFMENHPSCGACSPKIVFGNGKIQFTSGRKTPTLMSFIMEQFFLSQLFPTSRFASPITLLPSEYRGAPIQVDVLSGACILVRQEVVQEIGGIDPIYKAYYEDTDWCMRMKRAGWDLFLVPGSKVTHYHNQSMGKYRTWARIEEYKSAYIYFHRFTSMNEFRRILLRASRLTSLILRILLTLFMFLVRMKSWPDTMLSVKSYGEVIRWHFQNEKQEVKLFKKRFKIEVPNCVWLSDRQEI